MRTPLAGDASARRYERVRAPGRRAMLMDAPPASGLNLTPVVAVTAWLRDGGFSAPEIYAADIDAGLVLTEDLGDDLVHRLCIDRPDHAPDLYSAAIDVLAGIQDRPPPEARGGWTPPPYDWEVIGREARLMAEWYVPAATGEALALDAATEYEALIAGAFGGVAQARDVAVYRDYHAENLVWLPERRGAARIGLLDYQDMLVGHPAYDLASLLEDARRDVGDDLRAAMLRRYAERRGVDQSDLMRDFLVLSAQRNLKIMGLFTRLCRRDGKPRYLDLLPRVWRHLMADLSAPELAALRGWVMRWAPPPTPNVLERIRDQAA